MEKNDSNYVINCFSFIKQVVNVLNLNELNTINVPIIQILLDCIVSTNVNPQYISSKIKTALGPLLIKILEYSWQKSNKLSNNISNLLIKKLHDVTTLLICKKQYFTYCKFIWLLSFNNISLSHKEKKQLSFAINRLSLKIIESKKNNLTLVQNLIKTIFNDSTLVIPSIKSLITFYLSIKRIDDVLYWISKINNTHISKIDPLQISPEDILEWGEKISSDKKNIEKSIQIYLQFKDFLIPFYMHFLDEWKHISSFELTDHWIAVLERYLSFLKKLLKSKNATNDCLQLFSKAFAITIKHLIYSENNNSLQLLLATLDNIHIDELRSLLQEILASSKKISTSNHMQKVWYLFQKLPESNPKNLYNQQMIKESSDLWLQLLILINEICSPPFFNILNKLPFEFTFPKDIDNNITLQFVNILIKILEYNTKNHLTAIDVQEYIHKLFYHHQLPADDPQVVKLKTNYCLHALRNNSLERSTELLLESSSYLLCSDNGDLVNILTIFYKKINDFLKKSNAGISEEDGKKIILLSEVIINNKWIEPFPSDLIRLLITIEVKRNIENVIHLISIGIANGIRTHIIEDLINLIPILCIELKNEKLQKSIENILTYLENSAKNATEKIYHHFLITYFTTYYNCYLENQNKRLEAVNKFIENSQIYLNQDIEKTCIFQILSKIIVKENFEEKLLESIRNSFKEHILSQAIQQKKKLDYEHFFEILLLKILSISSIKEEGIKLKKTIMIANELLIQVMSYQSIIMSTKMDLLEKFFFWPIGIYGNYYNLHHEYCRSILKLVKNNKALEIPSGLYAKIAIKIKDFDFLTNCNEKLNEIFLNVIESYLKYGSLIGITEALIVISFGKNLIKDNGKTFSLITNKILNTISENANKFSLHKFPHHLFQNISKLLLSEKINYTIFSKPIISEENFLEFEKSNYYRNTWLSFADHYIIFFKNRFKEFQTSLNYNPGKEFLEIMLKAKQNQAFEGYNNYLDAFSKLRQAFPLLEGCCASSIISDLLTNLLLDFVNIEDFSITITTSIRNEAKNLILSWFDILVKISPKLPLKLLTKNNKILKIFPDEQERKNLIKSYELQKKSTHDSKITQVKLYVLISKRKAEKIYLLSQHLLNNNLSVFEDKVSNETVKKMVLLLLKQAKHNAMNSNDYCECAFNLTKKFLNEELNHLLVKLCKSISVYCDREIKLKCIQFLIQLSFENEFGKIKKENYEACWHYILKLEEEKTFDQIIELWNIKFKDITKSKIADDLKKQLEFKFLLSQMPELRSSKKRDLFLRKIINNYNNYDYKFKCYYLLAIKLDDVELQSIALKKYISFFLNTPSFINDKQKTHLLISQLQVLRQKFPCVSFDEIVDSILFIVNDSATINEALFLELSQWKSHKVQEIVLNKIFEFLQELDKDEESNQIKINKLSKTAKTVLKNILTKQAAKNKNNTINILVNCLQIISLDYEFFKDITNYIPHELIGNAFKHTLQMHMSQPYTDQTIKNVTIILDKLHMIFHLNNDVIFIVLDEYVKLLSYSIESSTDKNFHYNYNKFTELENLFFNILRNSLINDYEIDEDDIISDQKIFEEFTNNSWTPKQHHYYSQFFIHSKISIFQNMIKATETVYNKENIIDFICTQMNYFSKNFAENENIQGLLISLIDKPVLYFLEKNIYSKFLSSYIGAINTILSNVKMNIPAERCLTLALISSSSTSNNSQFKKLVPEKFHNHSSIPTIIKHIIDIYSNIEHSQPHALAFNLFINHQTNELANAYEKKQECLASLANNIQKHGLESSLNNINAVIHYHAIMQHELDNKNGSKIDFYKNILTKSLESYAILILNNSEKISSIKSLLKLIFCTLKEVIKDPYYSKISSIIGNFLIKINPIIASSNNISEAKELFFIETKSKETANSLKKSYLIWQKNLPKS